MWVAFLEVALLAWQVLQVPATHMAYWYDPSAYQTLLIASTIACVPQWPLACSHWQISCRRWKGAMGLPSGTLQKPSLNSASNCPFQCFTSPFSSKFLFGISVSTLKAGAIGFAERGCVAAHLAAWSAKWLPFVIYELSFWCALQCIIAVLEGNWMAVSNLETNSACAMGCFDAVRNPRVSIALQ